MRIETEVKLDFCDVLIRPKRSTLSSRNDVSLFRELVFPHTKNKVYTIPLLVSNLFVTGTISMAKAMEKHNCAVVLHKFYNNDILFDFFYESKNNSARLNHWVSIGINDNDLAKFDDLYKKFAVPNLCVDIANGYQEIFVEKIKYLRDKYKNLNIMAGNVVTGDMTEALLLAGADVVKIGIGNGNLCTTRKVTGVGYPQLSAVIECADAAHGLKGLVCSDGGITCTGDISKAFCSGADFVMAGSIFAGHDECECEIIEENNKKYMIAYGMASKMAQEKHFNIKNYRASEGREVKAVYKGSVENTISEILGGLRSTLTYIGANKLKEASKRTTFVMVNRQLSNYFNDKN